MKMKDSSKSYWITAKEELIEVFLLPVRLDFFNKQTY